MARLDKALADLPALFTPGRVPRDQQLLDLFADNIREALAGGAVEQWKLGQAIAQFLAEQDAQRRME